MQKGSNKADFGITLTAVLRPSSTCKNDRCNTPTTFTNNYYQSSLLQAFAHGCPDYLTCSALHVTFRQLVE